MRRPVRRRLLAIIRHRRARSSSRRPIGRTAIITRTMAITITIRTRTCGLGSRAKPPRTVRDHNVAGGPRLLARGEDGSDELECRLDTALPLATSKSELADGPICTANRGPTNASEIDAFCSGANLKVPTPAA